MFSCVTKVQLGKTVVDFGELVSLLDSDVKHRFDLVFDFRNVCVDTLSLLDFSQ